MMLTSEIKKKFNMPKTRPCISSVQIQLVDNLKKKIPTDCIITLDVTNCVSGTKNYVDEMRLECGRLSDIWEFSLENRMLHQAAVASSFE